jgi:hypothetical protein
MRLIPKQNLFGVIGLIQIKKSKNTCKILYNIVLNEILKC